LVYKDSLSLVTIFTINLFLQYAIQASSVILDVVFLLIGGVMGTLTVRTNQMNSTVSNALKVKHQRDLCVQHPFKYTFKDPETMRVSKIEGKLIRSLT
jgi:uncharacterized membrane protein YqgA involved in biofilm formation